MASALAAPTGGRLGSVPVSVGHGSRRLPSRLTARSTQDRPRAGRGTRERILPPPHREAMLKGREWLAEPHITG